MNTTARDPAAARTLWELLALRAARTPDALALVQQDPHPPVGDRALTFGALRARAERVAAGLRELGVRPGSRVLWQLPTRIETVVLTLALARLGAVQSPLVPSCRDAETEYALRATGAGFLAVPGVWRGHDHLAAARRLAAGLPEPPLVFTAYTVLPQGDPGTLPAPPDDGTAVRWIHWTSGTTSAPKGVLHSDSSLLASGARLTGALRPTPADVGSIAFPYAHVGGLVYTVMLLLRGFPALLVERFSLPDSLGAYRRHGVTLAGGSTVFYTLFLAEQRKHPGRRLLPALRLLAGGGAPRPPELHEAVGRELGCGLVHGYGMTEAPVITMGSPDDTPRQLATTEGRPVPGMRIRVTGADGTPVPPGETGEIRLRGDTVCRGYLDPRDTAEAFDTDGFLATGDLGRLTEDGRLVLTGRTKDVILRKGETISAQEVEQALLRHPAVEAVAVIGLPDALRGERVCAVVQPAAGAAPPTLAGLTAHLRTVGLAVHKFPERLELVDALPRDATLGKVRKDALRSRYTRP
ncbi:class I adenylate-forming enzyme family protein [Streptomyces gamaensis]|uniref:Class I adenylate-forming enzyme family protein n=1 Tax=Streptomyces gamaensis TaxID=1763542 RepID=A0ABW0Z3Z8_9ACTN